jgi:hypothetical protein
MHLCCQSCGTGTAGTDASGTAITKDEHVAGLGPWGRPGYQNTDAGPTAAAATMTAVASIAAIPAGTTLAGVVLAKTAAAAGAASAALTTGSAVAAVAAVSGFDSALGDIDHGALIEPDTE